MAEAEVEKRLAELRRELDYANRLAQYYLSVNDTQQAEYLRSLSQVKRLQQELSDARQKYEDVRRQGERFELLYLKTKHVEWPMLMFKWGQRVEVWRTGRRDDPNGQIFVGWWPARIVGCECRQFSILNGPHVLYEVELEGRDGTLMRLPNEIRAIQAAEAPDEAPAEAPAR